MVRFVEMNVILLVCFITIYFNISAIQSQLIFKDNLRNPSTPAPATTSDCRTPSGKPGHCINIRKCPSLLTHAKRGNVRHLRQSVCGRQGQLTNLCCPDHVRSPSSDSHSSPTETPSTPSTTNTFRSADDCGVSPLQPSRIVGGQPVKFPGEFPWQAGLYYRDPEIPVQCGGVLISSRWILTAAHCILSNGPAFARLGDVNLNTVIDDDPRHPPQHIRIVQAIPHEHYENRRTFPKRIDNDIALLKLAEPAQLSDVVKPICLPEQARPISELERKHAVIAGWGITEFDGLSSSVMMWARVNTSDHNQCVKNYDLARVTVHRQKQLCANGNAGNKDRTDCRPEEATEPRCQGGVDTCRGDSGGPLIMSRPHFNRDRWYCEGIVSFAIGCGNALFPGIYTRVDNYLDWISRHVTP